MGVVRALLDAGADVNHKNRHNETALYHAVEQRHDEVMSHLLRAGADPDITESMEGFTPLHVLAQAGGAGAADMCEALLRAGATPDVDSDFEGTPLVLAATSGHLDIAALLLAYDCELPYVEEDEEEEPSTAAIRGVMPEAAAAAQRQLDALLAPEALPEAAARLQARLAAATAGGGGCPLARLRALRSAVVSWEQAWRHDAPPPPGQPQRHLRFRSAVDRLAWAQALRACAEAAESTAAQHTVSVLRQLRAAAAGAGGGRGAASRRREQEKLSYAAAVCVGKWWELKQAAGPESQRELRAAEAGVASARAEGEATVARLRRPFDQLLAEARGDD